MDSQDFGMLTSSDPSHQHRSVKAFCASPDPYAACVAVCISGLLACGVFVLDHVFAPKIEIVGMPSAVLLVVIALAASIPLYVFIHWLFLRLDDTLEVSHSDELNTSGATGYAQLAHLLKTSWLKYSSLILLGWLPYLLIRFPGNIDSDTFWELEQLYGLVPKNDQHPYFDTLVFGLFWHLGDALHTHLVSLLVYAVAQMVITAAALGLSLCYLRFIGMPRAMYRACLAFVSVFPIIPLFAQTMAKDMLFAWIWVLFVLCVMEIARSNGAVLRSIVFLGAFAAIILLLMLTKKTGVYLTLGSVIVMLIFIKHRVRLLCALLIPIVLFLGVWTAVLLPQWGVAPGPEREMLAVPAQQSAMYIKRNSATMSKHDWHVLSRVFRDPQSMPQTYIPARGDNTKGRWIENAKRSDKEAYVTWWVRSFFKDPGSYVLATAANTLPLYYPDVMTQGSESTLFYGDKINPQGDPDDGLINTLINYSGNTATRADIVKLMSGTQRYPIVSELSATFNTWYLNINRAFPIVFSKVLFTTWIPLFALAYCFRQRKWIGAICLVPAVLTLLTLVISPIAIPRYVVPVLYTVPLTLGCLFIGSSHRRNTRAIARGER